MCEFQSLHCPLIPSQPNLMLSGQESEAVHQHSRFGTTVKLTIAFVVGMVLAASVTNAFLQHGTTRRDGDLKAFDSDKLIEDLTAFDSDKLIEETLPPDVFKSSVNCNCDAQRLKLVKTETSVHGCWNLCRNDQKCKSFAVWTKQSKTPSKCATFAKQCEVYADGHSASNVCVAPTGTAYFNVAYNMRHNLASRNCNCSKTKLKEVNNLVAQGHPTERCWKLTCENDARCKSFGIWFGKNMRGETIFHCASFDSECPENENGAVAGTKCPVPELMPRWNLAFNKLPIQ